MDENKRALGSNLDRVDAYVLQPDDYDDAPELTEEWFEQADFYDGGRLIRRGKRPETERQEVSLHLSRDVLAYFQAQGPDWEKALDCALAQWIASHPDPQAKKSG